MLKVVAIILFKKKKILISSRPENKSFEFFWEFPGGKVKENESLKQALKREIKEELSIDIEIEDLFFFKKYDSFIENRLIKLHFFICNKWTGRFISMENQNFEWVKTEQLKDYNFLPSNRLILEKIKSKNFNFPTLIEK